MSIMKPHREPTFLIAVFIEGALHTMLTCGLQMDEWRRFKSATPAFEPGQRSPSQRLSGRRKTKEH
jgi:hypothetical protein